MGTRAGRRARRDRMVPLAAGRNPLANRSLHADQLHEDWRDLRVRAQARPAGIRGRVAYRSAGVPLLLPRDYRRGATLADVSGVYQSDWLPDSRSRQNRTQVRGLRGQVLTQIPGTVLLLCSGWRRSDRLRAAPNFTQEPAGYPSSDSATYADPRHRGGAPYELRASHVAQARSEAHQHSQGAAGALRAHHPGRHGQNDDGGVASDGARIQYPARSRGQCVSQESDPPRTHARSFHQAVWPVQGVRPGESMVPAFVENDANPAGNWSVRHRAMRTRRT